MEKAVYVGSFDPPTLGHLDIIERAAPLFEKLFVVVAENASKTSLFSVEERVALLTQCLSGLPSAKSVEICAHSGLTVDFCHTKQARVLVRGLRAMSDFEKELQMAAMNRHLDSKIETLHMMTDEKYFFVSSSLVKEVAKHGGSLKRLVPLPVETAIVQKLSKKKG